MGLYVSSVDPNKSVGTVKSIRRSGDFVITRFVSTYFTVILQLYYAIFPGKISISRFPVEFGLSP